MQCSMFFGYEFMYFPDLVFYILVCISIFPSIYFLMLFIKTIMKKLYRNVNELCTYLLYSLFN